MLIQCNPPLIHLRAGQLSAEHPGLVREETRHALFEYNQNPTNGGPHATVRRKLLAGHTDTSLVDEPTVQTCLHLTQLQ